MLAQARLTGRGLTPWMLGIANNVLGGGGAATYADRVLALGPIRYWPLSETSGTQATELVAGDHGTYARDVSTMGTGEGIGDGNTAPLFNGADDVVNIYSSGFNTAFDGTLGTLVLWAKVSGAGVWTDSSTRFLAHIAVNNQNRIRLYKSDNPDDRLIWIYEANDVAETVTKDSLSATGWLILGLTWSDAAEEMKAYYGTPGSLAQEGNTQITLGTWSGSLSNTETVIGSLNTIAVWEWDGYLSHVAVFDKVLTLAELQSLATV